MKKTILFMVAVFLLATTAYSQNVAIAKLAKSLQFTGVWTTNQNAEGTHQLKPGDILARYNGKKDFPEGSNYLVGESKTFARIVAKECGIDLPAGYEYATGKMKTVKAGDILQRAKKPHTMIVVSVGKGKHDKGLVVVLHTDYAARHKVVYHKFRKKWLCHQGFKVYKASPQPSVNTVEAIRTLKQYPAAIQRNSRFGGTWRIVVTGTNPYYRVGQGTIVSHSGPGPCKIVVNETRSVSNTMKADCGVKAEVVSASVGFSVTSSFSRSLSYWRDVPNKKYGYVDLYYKYMVKRFKVYYDPWVGSEYLAGHGEAWKFQAVEFQYRESSH